MGSIFKDDTKPTKIQLIQIGRVLTDTIQEADKINERLEDFEKTMNAIIEENTIFVSTKMMQEALEEVQLLIGKLELGDSLKKK